MTPMLKQYLEIKKQHEGALLLFRLGDFYELFFDDAEEASKLLDLTLTGRGKGENRIPMCGVPYHAAEGYIAKLTKLGKKVAICDQVSDPNEPGIVDREVVRIVTPGTTLDEKVLDQKANNFVAAVTAGEADADVSFDFAYADITTGEFSSISLSSMKALQAEIERLKPSEIIIPPEFDLKTDVYITEHAFDGGDAAALLMNYLETTQKTSLQHMTRSDSGHEESMPIDEATLKNLELMETLREGNREGSLLWVLDKTQTAMGGRMIRSFLIRPLAQKEDIEKRLGAVEELTQKRTVHDDLQGLLKSVMDLERLLARLSMGRGNARDLVGLKNSLMQVPHVQNLLSNATSNLLKDVCDNIDPLYDLVSLIERAIVPDPPLNMNEGGIIADGFNTELDEIKAVSREGKQFIQSLQQKEIERTGITNLKVRYNKVFGYYLEVSKGQVSKVPEEWIRKQTLVNAERYITPELKEFEEKVLGAEEKIAVLEQKIFSEIREKVVAEIERIQRTAKYLALLDVMCSFTSVALQNGYCKPSISGGDDISIAEGRHPVVEKMSFSARFVPNGTALQQSGERLQLITGPNMGGKSTYLRQVALIVLMAHIGSFVPARSAEICLVDRIFTRVGASDNLVRGQSTFMVEMQEAAHILENATERSLIILDEIGRGTSTYDGMSIAWAITEYIHDNIQAKTLFATHYHELISLTDKLANAANYCVAVKENEEEGVVFLYTVMKGGASRSYGIEVAKLAGMPPETVRRAHQILRDLEEGVHESAIQKELDARPAEDQSALFEREHNPLKEEFDKINPDQMTPLEALQKLHDIKNGKY